MGDPKEGVLLGFHIEWVHMGGSVWRVRMGSPYGGALWGSYGGGGAHCVVVLRGFSYRAAP